jgi:myo-inositol-1(or 4)-monophosphatase
VTRAVVSSAEVTELREAAVRIARAAGVVLRQRLAVARTVSAKDRAGIDLVTDADRASEALILEALGRAFPEHSVLAEEQGALERGAVRWLVDPLDGTVNYAHGLPHFCVSLAVEGPGADGASEVLAGAVVNPLLDEVFSAGRGQGATLNGVPLRVSSPAGLEQALLCTGFPYWLRDAPARPLALFNRLVVRAQGLRRMGAAALDLAYLAAGRFDAFFEYGLKPWDTAAGALLVREAGGVVRRLDGGVYDVQSPDIVAAPPSLVEALLAERRAVEQAG